MGPKILDATVVTMENKIKYAINHTKFVSKKYPSVDRICKSDEWTWEIEGLMTPLSDIVTDNFLELIDDTYKVKEIDFVEETQISSQIDDFNNSDTEKMVIRETQVNSRINKVTHSPILSKAETESLQDFQKTILSGIKNMRSFIETVERESSNSKTL